MEPLKLARADQAPELAHLTSSQSHLRRESLGSPAWSDEAQPYQRTQAAQADDLGDQFPDEPNFYTPPRGHTGPQLPTQSYAQSTDEVERKDRSFHSKNLTSEGMQIFLWLFLLGLSVLLAAIAVSFYMPAIRALG